MPGCDLRNGQANSEPALNEGQHDPRAGKDGGEGEDHDAERPSSGDGRAAIGEVAGVDGVFEFAQFIVEPSDAVADGLGDEEPEDRDEHAGGGEGEHHGGGQLLELGDGYGKQNGLGTDPGAVAADEERVCIEDHLLEFAVVVERWLEGQFGVGVDHGTENIARRGWVDHAAIATTGGV